MIKNWTKGLYNEVSVDVTPFNMAVAIKDGENLKCIHGYWKCKDYLQDFFWIENQKIEDSRAIYGFIHHNMNLTSDPIYIVIDNLDFNAKKYFDNIKLFWALPDHKYSISVELIDNKIVLDITSLFNAKPYEISLYATLFRLQYAYTNTYDTVISFLTDIESIGESISGMYSKDIERITVMLPMLNEIYLGIDFDQQWSKYKSGYNCHDGSGILSMFENLSNKYSKA